MLLDNAAALPAVTRAFPRRSETRSSRSSVIGTTVEWYDFLIYGTASALVFSKLFFPSFDPVVGSICGVRSYAVGSLPDLSAACCSATSATRSAARPCCP